MQQLPNTSFVSSNLQWQTDPAFTGLEFEPYYIAEFGSEKVGFTGSLNDALRSQISEPGELVRRRSTHQLWL